MHDPPSDLRYWSFLKEEFQVLVCCWRLIFFQTVVKDDRHLLHNMRFGAGVPDIRAIEDKVSHQFLHLGFQQTSDY